MEKYQNNVVNLSRKSINKSKIVERKDRKCNINKRIVTSVFHQPFSVHTKRICKVQGTIIKSRNSYHLKDSNLSVLNFLLHYNPTSWKGPCIS